MPLSRGDKQALLPLKGLNTEANPLAFPPDAFVSGVNVELAYDPLRIQRRRGLTNRRGNTNIVDLPPPSEPPS